MSILRGKVEGCDLQMSILRGKVEVSDLQMLRETGREGSFWWKKEAHDEVNAAFPSLFRDFDVNTERMSLISDDEQESGNDD